MHNTYHRSMAHLVCCLLFALILAGCKNCPLVPAGPEGEGQVAIEGEGTSHEGSFEGGSEGGTEGSPSEGSVDGDPEGQPVEGEPTEGAMPSTLPVCDPVCGYQVVNVYPHDRGAYTQGLVYYNGDLIEGTGYWEESELRVVTLETGVIQRRFPLTNQAFCAGQRCFGEGVTLFADRIIQLTWLKKKGFVYDLNTFQPVGEFDYEGQGWGITHDGARLIMSDGTATLRFLDPITFEFEGEVDVMRDGVPVDQLNELEYIDGEVFANVYQTNEIVRIDPESGNVTGTVDLTGLLPPGDREPSTNVLNGIAWDRTNRRLFVTGKRWPKIFEITLTP